MKNINLLQVAIVGAVTYFAVDYMMKRKAKNAAAPTGGVKPAAPTARTMEAAMLEEEGEEGMIMTEAQNQQIGAARHQERPLDWQSANGWESENVLSAGI